MRFWKDMLKFYVPTYITNFYLCEFLAENSYPSAKIIKYFSETSHGLSQQDNNNLFKLIIKLNISEGGSIKLTIMKNDFETLKT